MFTVLILSSIYAPPVPGFISIHSLSWLGGGGLAVNHCLRASRRRKLFSPIAFPFTNLRHILVFDDQLRMAGECVGGWCSFVRWIHSADTNTFPVIVITLHYLLRLMNGNRILLCFCSVGGGWWKLPTELSQSGATRVLLIRV